MVGSAEDPQMYGIIPCAISWLFKGIQEQKSRTGARFSVRVSAVEVSGPACPIKDLLAGQSNGNFTNTHTYSRIVFTLYRSAVDPSKLDTSGGGAAYKDTITFAIWSPRNDKAYTQPCISSSLFLATSLSFSPGIIRINTSVYVKSNSDGKNPLEF